MAEVCATISSCCSLYVYCFATYKVTRGFSRAPETPGPRTKTSSRPLSDMVCGYAVTGLFGGHFLSFHWVVSMVLDLALVLDDLAIDFVCQKVDGSVKVFVACFAVNVFAGQADSHFSNVLQLLDRERDLYVDDLIEVSTDARHLLGCVF